mmetsp:Transcript_39754/g.118317  ORF Transcript_39754/g.118317 Transcript_39754/m.118317 type:complete len:226 (-) Transcript_39754:1036-1713(-)
MQLLPASPRAAGAPVSRTAPRRIGGVRAPLPANEHKAPRVRAHASAPTTDKATADASPTPERPDAEHQPPASRPIEVDVAWDKFLTSTLSKQLVHVLGASSRASVETTAVAKTNVTRSALRAEELDVVLSVTASHRKSPEHKAEGTVRVTLTTGATGGTDKIAVREAQWSGVDGMPPQIIADFTGAAEGPLQSALATRLNEVLWSVEEHCSMEEHSMEELSMEEN